MDLSLFLYSVTLRRWIVSNPFQEQVLAFLFVTYPDALPLMVFVMYYAGILWSCAHGLESISERSLADVVPGEETRYLHRSQNWGVFIGRVKNIALDTI